MCPDRVSVALVAPIVLPTLSARVVASTLNNPVTEPVFVGQAVALMVWYLDMFPIDHPFPDEDSVWSSEVVVRHP